LSRSHLIVLLSYCINTHLFHLIHHASLVDTGSGRIRDGLAAAAHVHASNTTSEETIQKYLHILT
jgi:hypothetical protein